MRGKRPPESLRATAERLRREGLTVTQISARLNIPRATIGGWVKGIERQRFCLLCGDEVVERRSAAFCSERHGWMFYDVLGARVYGPRRARRAA